MKKCKLFITLLLTSMYSCSEQESPIAQKHLEVKKMPVVPAQNYETALFDLQLHADTLLQKGIASYTAVQIFDKKQKPKYYFHSFSKQKGELPYCELSGKDTIISERIITSKPKEMTTEKKWHQIHRKVLITTMSNEDNETTFLLEKEKNNRTDTTKFVRKKGALTMILYPSGDQEIYDYSVKNRTGVTYLNKKKDTLFQYQMIDDNKKVISKLFSVGLSHSYRYIYNQAGQLTEIIWKENNKKVNASIQFQYNENDLPAKRITKSTIPAFGNSVTTFTYQYQ